MKRLGRRACVQVLGLFNGRFGIVRQQRRDFQRDPTVYAAGSIINRPKQIRGLPEIVKRKFEEQFLPGLAFRELALNCIIVVAAVLDGVVEDGRIRCQPGNREFVDIAAKHARLEQAARDVVEPEALTQVVHDLSGFHDVTSITPPTWTSSVQPLWLAGAGADDDAPDLPCGW